MLITPAYLEKYNGIIQDTDDDVKVELVNTYIGTAQRIISDYVGFDCQEVIAEDSEYTDDVKYTFKGTCARIATLLQVESDSNIGVNTSGSEGVSRSFLNVVDYTPYLKILSAFRKNTGM